jgi:hypothetical protein
MRRTGQAPYRRRPVNSALDRRARRQSNGPATSNQGAQMQIQSWLLHATTRALRPRRQSSGRHPRCAAVPRTLESTGPVCDATNRPVSQGRFAPPCFAGQSVPGSRRQEAAHLKRRWELPRRLVCQRRKSERPPLQFVSASCPKALLAQPHWLYKVFMATTTAHRLRSNWSFNRSANGWPSCPRGSACISSATRASRPSVVARLTLR